MTDLLRTVHAHICIHPYTQSGHPTLNNASITYPVLDYVAPAKGGQGKVR